MVFKLGRFYPARGNLAKSRDSMGCSDRVEKKYYRLLGENGQGCCYTSYSAQDEPNDKRYSVPDGNSSVVEKS